MTTDKPKRIQRKRTKGWRLPAGAICVTRGTKWGNPFRIGDLGRTRDDVIEVFEHIVEHMDAAKREEWLAPLRGHDLACFCGLDQRCHADVLLAWANKDGER